MHSKKSGAGHLRCIGVITEWPGFHPNTEMDMLEIQIQILTRFPRIVRWVTFLLSALCDYCAVQKPSIGNIAGDSIYSVRMYGN